MPVVWQSKIFSLRKRETTQIRASHRHHSIVVAAASCFQFFSKVLSSIKKIFFPLQAETKLTTASVPLCNGGGGGQNGNPVPPALSNNPNGNPAPTIAVQDASESSDQGPIKPNMAHKAWYMHWFHAQNKSVLILDLDLNFQRS